MLQLIPRPLHRLLLYFAHAVRVVWWRVAKPRLVDCRVVALDEAGRVLLVRHSYGSGVWMLPGGGPRRGEGAVEAAMRELREEVGCVLTEAREVAKPDPHAARCMYVVVGRASGNPAVDGREVVEGRFFPLGELPKPVSPQLGGRLTHWIRRYRESAPTS